MNKLVFTILTMIDRHQAPLKSGHIARQLSLQGYDLSERTVRHHLKVLDQRGYTESLAKKGRKITSQGRQELSYSFACDRVGCIINKINNLSFLTDFNLHTLLGKVILNVTYVQEEKAPDALKVMSPILSSPYSFSNKVLMKKSGERIGDLTVPAGMAGIGTVCSMTLNGIFLKAGIPVMSKFGGIVRIEKNVPRNFISFIGYEKSSVAPLEIFMKSGMTDVLSAFNFGTGDILGSLREIPEVCLEDSKKLYKSLSAGGMGGMILFGQPAQPFFGMPITQGNAAMLILGGLNPVAALGEAGIAAENYTMDTMCDYEELVPVSAYARACSAPARAGRKKHREALLPARHIYAPAADELKQSTF